MSTATTFLPCGQGCFWDPGPIRPKWGDCNIRRSHSSEPVHEATLAYALDIEGYAASLRIHENFGCIQAGPHEEPDSSTSAAGDRP